MMGSLRPLIFVVAPIALVVDCVAKVCEAASTGFTFLYEKSYEIPLTAFERFFEQMHGDLPETESD